MHDTLTRYTVAALAFAFVVTTATAGLTVAVIATAAAAIAIAWPRLARVLAATRRPKPAPRRRMTAADLVPDDPSLVV